MSLFLSGTFVWVLVCTILTSGGDSIENLTNFFNTSVVFLNFFTKYIFFSDRHDVKISSLFYWIFFFFILSFEIWFRTDQKQSKMRKKRKEKRNWNAWRLTFLPMVLFLFYFHLPIMPCCRLLLSCAATLPCRHFIGRNRHVLCILISRKW